MSNSVFVLIFAGVAVLLLALLVSVLSHHKKSASQQLNLIGSIGVIEIQLNPEGAIFVNGELWRARLNEGTAAQIETKVRVVGTQGHLLLVEPESDQTFKKSLIKVIFDE